MDEYQAQYNFWSSFGVPAFDETSVPDEDELAAMGVTDYITYQAMDSMFDDVAAVSASIWTRSTSWLRADTIAKTIKSRLENGGETITFDGGMLWFTAGTPLAQNMNDPEDDRIRRKYLSVWVNFA